MVRMTRLARKFDLGAEEPDENIQSVVFDI
jgi:hypothetical protein